ncbi:ABC transporter permease [Treponema sp. TIM-1]|uniref:ABC transporter permease n=1 Tax=Treponema sp. TIM-1 TaxID=2898417 RepID=UPI00397F6CB0
MRNRAAIVHAVDIPKTKKRQSEFGAAMLRLRRNRSAMIGLGIFLLLAILAVFAPYISPYEYAKLSLQERFQGPSFKHWFGTDEMGRDLFTRIIYGGRYSLAVGFIATLVGLFFGVAVGAIAGFFGGDTDNIIMRFLDIFQSIPILLLSIVIATALGTGFDKTIMALSIAQIPDYARQMRASILRVRDLEYVEAANAIGCSTFRQILRYVLPNSFAPLIVSATMGVAGTILMTASLSYLGLGIQPPTPEWGAMLSGAKIYLRRYPYLLIFPGLAIGATVLGLNMFGDGLRDALDPRLKD